MRSMDVLSALTEVRDSFVLESALPPEEERIPVAPSRRRRGKDHSLGRVFSGGWTVAAVCTLVAAGTLGGLLYLGQHPPTPPMGTEGLSSALTDEPPVTEGISAASLTFVSLGDGTCAVKASDAFGASDGDIHLVVPSVSPNGETVVAVADYAFIWETGLKSVTLPDTVTAVGQWAFAECSSLKTVGFSEGLLEIGTAAFLGCTALDAVILPEGLTRMGDSVFSICTSLRSVTLPSTLASIPAWCFNGCAKLESIHLPEGLSVIGYSAFVGCESLAAVSLPATLTDVGKGAFAGCTGLREITLPAGVVTLSDLAFDGCIRLASLTLPEGLQSLGVNALRGCTALRILSYGGTRESWHALSTGATALPVGCHVYCADGVIK